MSGFFRPSREFCSFAHIETSPLLVKGCKFLSILGSHGHRAISGGILACHTFCDMGHPFRMVNFEDLLQLHILQSIKQLSCHYLFYNDLCLLRMGFQHSTSSMRGERSYSLLHRPCFFIWIFTTNM